MKTIYLLYSLIVFTILSSCTKLERLDYQNIPADQFFKTEADVKATITSYYGTAVMGLNGISYSAPGVMGESQTEMMEFAYDGNLGYFTNHFFLTASQYSSSLGNILASYSTIVKHISRGTNLISRLKTVPMDSTIRKRYIAEVSVVRAHCALWGSSMSGVEEVFLDAGNLANVKKTDRQPREKEQELAHYIVRTI